MKALIATGLGVLALGGVLLVANSGRSASAQSSLAGPAVVSQAQTNRTTLVNCGEGRQALVSTDPGTGASQVQCVATEMPAVAPGAFMPGVATALPVSQFAPAIVSPVQPAVQERVVYRDRLASSPASRTARSSSARRTSAPTYGRSADPTDSRDSEPSYSRTSEPSYGRNSEPSYGRNSEPSYGRTSDATPAPQGRSWKKSAIIIGGSTAAGAGVGAVLKGKDGAKKGAVVGLLGGTIYDIATRNKH